MIIRMIIDEDDDDDDDDEDEIFGIVTLRTKLEDIIIHNHHRH